VFINTTPRAASGELSVNNNRNTADTVLCRTARHFLESLSGATRLVGCPNAELVRSPLIRGDSCVAIAGTAKEKEKHE